MQRSILDKVRLKSKESYIFSKKTLPQILLSLSTAVI